MISRVCVKSAHKYHTVLFSADKVAFNSCRNDGRMQIQATGGEVDSCATLQVDDLFLQPRLLIVQLTPGGISTYMQKHRAVCERQMVTSKAQKHVTMNERSRKASPWSNWWSHPASSFCGVRIYERGCWAWRRTITALLVARCPRSCNWSAICDIRRLSAVDASSCRPGNQCKTSERMYCLWNLENKNCHTVYKSLRPLCVSVLHELHGQVQNTAMLCSHTLLRSALGYQQQSDRPFPALSSKLRIHHNVRLSAVCHRQCFEGSWNGFFIFAQVRATSRHSNTPLKQPDRSDGIPASVLPFFVARCYNLNVRLHGFDCCLMWMWLAVLARCTLSNVKNCFDNMWVSLHGVCSFYLDNVFKSCMCLTLVLSWCHH